jgi:hypothetical protein
MACVFVDQRSSVRVQNGIKESDEFPGARFALRNLFSFVHTACGGLTISAYEPYAVITNETPTPGAKHIFPQTAEAGATKTAITSTTLKECNPPTSQQT